MHETLDNIGSAKKMFMLLGISLMVLVGLCFLLLPDFGFQQWVGLIVLFIIGLGMTIAGSPNEKHQAQEEEGQY